MQSTRAAPSATPPAKSRWKAEVTRQRRVPHRVPCRVRLLDGDAQLLGQTVNISCGGLAVQLTEAIPEGTMVEALVPNLTGNGLCVRGHVRHLRRVLNDVFEVGIVAG